MLAFLTKWTKRSREGDPKENQRPAAEGAADAHKKRKLATPPTKARRPRSVPPPHPVGSSRVNIKQVSLDEGYVVLTNDGRTGVSIEGWTLRSGSTTTLAIPAGTVLDAHCAILVLAPSAKPPAVLKHSGMRQLRAKAPWTEGLMLYNRDGVLIDGEGGDSASRDSPFHGVLCRAEEYYRTLVSQLVAQRLFAKSPNFVGPSHVNAKNVRLTHDAREELLLLLEGVADRILQAAAARGRAEPLTASAMCVAVDEGLPACDVQRRAVAEAARSAEHRSLFLVSDEQVSAFAATLESARRPALSQPAVHALAVAIDYLLAELVETVATIAYSETSNGMAQGEPTLPDAELCTGALDKLALVTAVRMDPDLHKIFAVAVDV